MSKDKKREETQEIKENIEVTESEDKNFISEYEEVNRLLINDGVEPELGSDDSDESDIKSEDDQDIESTVTKSKKTNRGKKQGSKHENSDEDTEKSVDKPIITRQGIIYFVLILILLILVASLSILLAKPDGSQSSVVTNEIWGNESIRTVTSVKGLEFTVPESWTVNNFWDYSQATLTKPDDTSSSGTSTDEIFEGIVVTTGYLANSSDTLDDFADQIYSAVAETSETSSTRADKTIGSEKVKYIEMSKDGNFAGMYYIFHDNLAIEIVCSAQSKETLENYQSEVEKIVKGFRYMKVTATDFETASSEPIIGDTQDESQVESSDESKEGSKVESSTEEESKQTEG